VNGAEECHSFLSDRLAGVDGVRVEHVTCLGYCGSGPNAMLEDEGRTAVFSLAAEGAVDALAKALANGDAHEAAEPENVIH
jgi:hypothetical protein